MPQNGQYSTVCEAANAQCSSLGHLPGSSIDHIPDTRITHLRLDATLRILTFCGVRPHLWSMS